MLISFAITADVVQGLDFIEFYFAAIGAFLNLPHTMNAATTATKILNPMTDASPLET